MQRCWLGLLSSLPNRRVRWQFLDSPTKTSRPIHSEHYNRAYYQYRHDKLHTTSYQYRHFPSIYFVEGSMCTTDNIRLLINPITFLKLILALYVCIVGIQFASTDFIHKAYGVYFISSGVGIFFMGFFSGGVCVSRHHCMHSYPFADLLCAVLIDCSSRKHLP